MKVVVLGMLRTRSSFLLSTICNNYNLQDKWEPYEKLTRDVTGANFNKSPDNLWLRYKEKTIEFTSKLMSENNFGLKLFSHGFFNSYKIENCICKNQQIRLDSSDMLDLEKHLQISNYNKVFFLTRNNYVDNICSYLFGLNTKMLFEKEQALLINFYNKPILINYDKLHFQSMIIKQMLMRVFEGKIIEYKIPYTKLDYQEVPHYITSNFPNTETDFIETKFDYKKLIKNYDQIINEIEEQKEKFLPVIDSLLS